MPQNELKALCLPPVKEFSSTQIKQLRERNKASQAFRGLSQHQPVDGAEWEQGQKRPNGPSLKLLNLVAKLGLDALA